VDEVPRPATRRAGRLLARLALCLLGSALVALPIAVERGLEHAQVRDTIGLVPARLTLTGTSESELRLGILGTIEIPVSRGPVGVAVTADGAPTTPGSGGVASYFSPEMLKVYGGLFHDPRAAIARYVEQLTDDLQRRILISELTYTLVGGALLMLGSAVVDPALRRRVEARPVVSAAVALGVGLLASGVVALAEFHDWASQPDRSAAEKEYPLPSLDGTPAAGAVTDSALLHLAIEDALPKVRKLIARQDEQTRAYETTAEHGLEAAGSAMTGPRPGEVAVLLQSDMHCNAAMISLQRRVVALLADRFGRGTVGLLAITGDLTTNGTAAEGDCVDREAAVAAGAPVAAVTGNHDSDVTVRQMAAAGMHVLTGSTRDLAGLRVLGAGDPNRTEMFGPTATRGQASEQSVGTALYAKAVGDHPDLVLAHEGYAVQSFLGPGVSSMDAFLAGRGSPTQWWDDRIRDLPASAVFYGHWHRDVAPRVVWNSDGTWTLVMELDTSGGAIADPTLNHFSTPWSQPQQPASFPVVFEDRDTGLVTGYQLYGFGTDGSVTVSPRVDVGSRGGRAVEPHHS
jgi:hypothetical protein